MKFECLLKNRRNTKLNANGRVLHIDAEGFVEVPDEATANELLGLPKEFKLCPGQDAPPKHPGQLAGDAAFAAAIEAGKSREEASKLAHMAAAALGYGTASELKQPAPVVAPPAAPVPATVSIAAFGIEADDGVEPSFQNALPTDAPLTEDDKPQAVYPALPGENESWPDPVQSMTLDYLKAMADAYEVPTKGATKAVLVEKIKQAMYA